MKNIIICLFIFTSIVSFITKADTVFVKSGGILAPIEVNSSTNNSPIDAASLIDSISLSSRTETSAILSGSLADGAASVNTWFVLQIGQIFGFQAQDRCSNLTRRNEQILNNASETNVFRATNLLPGTGYTVTFCGQPSNSNSTVATSTVFDSFTTKRNESTLVVHDCNSNEIFRSIDGPLDILVVESVPFFPNGFGTIDSSQFIIDNVGVSETVLYDITRSGFAAQTLGNSRTVAPRNRQIDSTFVQGGTDSNGEPELSYGVRIFSNGDWTATFSCRELDCVATLQGPTPQQATGQCGSERPL